MYTMKPEYSIGIPKLDEQHQTLFSLIDDAQSLLQDENILYKYDDLTEIIQGLKDYADVHFSEEVSLMESINYPRLQLHMAEHESFCQKMDSFFLDMDTISLGTQDKKLSEILDYLNEWLHIHVLDCDPKIAHYMNGKAI